MAIPLNPYVAGNPVGDSPAFIGRVDVLREVLRVLRRSQDNAIVLYGQRRIGKTSILQHLAAWLPREGTYRPVYFDLQDKAAWPLSRVLQDLARTIAHTLGQPDPDLGPDPETAFRDEWLPAVLGDLPEGCSLVLLFDEFDVLADPQKEQAAAAFFPYLRGLLTSDPQRLQFAFVIGRNVDDLDNIALSLFKGTPAQRVSLLSEEDTKDLVRLSETNGTLRWILPVMLWVYKLTYGHPFLTQQLCSHVWERAYDEEPEEPPTVTRADVDAAVPEALEASRNTLEWLWDGLPPAERVVASALAEAGPGPITQDELERLLHESGVRVVIRELQNAPQLLQDWDLIEPADSGYRFRVELLRRWIAENKPLKRVQEELDRVEPVADYFYRAALGLYQSGQLDQAIAPLRQAVSLNPNHVGANQLLADILLAQGQADEAAQLLERLYEYQPASTRPRLVQAYLAQAQAAESEGKQLALYERILELDPTQQAATAKVAEIKQEMRRRELASSLQELEALEQEGRYPDALDMVQDLADEFPEMRDWTSDLERLERKTHLAGLYQRALGALESGDRQTAQTLLAQVVALEPGYEEATRYLHRAVTGVDAAALQAQLEAEKKDREEAEAIAGEEEEAPSTPKPVSQQQLSPWNPLDHLRLLWWVLVTPRRLKVYRKAFGEKAECRVGKWLVSTLIWLPFFIPTLALGVVTLPRAEDAPSSTACLLISLGLAMAWMLTGQLGEIDNYDTGVVAGTMAGVVAGSVAGVMAFCVAFGVTGDVGGIVAFGMTFGVVFGVTGVVAGIVAGVVAGIMAFVVALGVAINVAFGVVGGMWAVLAGNEADVVVDSIAVGVALGVAVGVVVFLAGVGSVSRAAGVVTSDATGVMKGSPKTVRPCWLARGALVALVLAHAFLVWFSFLGGWQVFQPVGAA